MNFIQRINQEKAELQRRREKLVQEISAIDGEFKDMEAALRVAQKIEGRSAGVEEQHLPISSDRIDLNLQHKGRKVRTIGDAAVKTLQESYPTGLTRKHILVRASSRLRRKINPSSLTGELWRLKGAGRIRIEGRTWFYVLPSDLGNKDAPPAITDEASNSEGLA